MYVRDEVAAVTRPVKELVDWAVVELAPGESRTVAFTIARTSSGTTGRTGATAWTPGEFALWIAPDSASGEPVSFTLGTEDASARRWSGGARAAARGRRSGAARDAALELVGDGPPAALRLPELRRDVVGTDVADAAQPVGGVERVEAAFDGLLRGPVVRRVAAVAGVMTSSAAAASSNRDADQRDGVRPFAQRHLTRRDRDRAHDVDWARCSTVPRSASGRTWSCSSSATVRPAASRWRARRDRRRSAASRASLLGAQGVGQSLALASLGLQPGGRGVPGDDLGRGAHLPGALGLRLEHEVGRALVHRGREAGVGVPEQGDAVLLGVQHRDLGEPRRE